MRYGHCGHAHVHGPFHRPAQATPEAGVLLESCQTHGVEQQVESHAGGPAAGHVPCKIAPRGGRDHGARPPMADRGVVAGPKELVHFHPGQPSGKLIVEIARHRKHPALLFVGQKSGRPINDSSVHAVFDAHAVLPRQKSGRFCPRTPFELTGKYLHLD
jgi:hypothetical protein